MNKYNKKRFPILFKVFVVHLFIILIIDINISAVVNKDLKSFSEINEAKFLNHLNKLINNKSSNADHMMDKFSKNENLNDLYDK